MRVVLRLVMVAALAAWCAPVTAVADDAGFTVHVEPGGGIVPAPPPAAAPTTAPRAAVAPTHPALAPLAPAVGAVPRESTKSGGGTSLDARGRFRSELHVTVGPDGRPTFGCVDTAGSAP